MIRRNSDSAARYLLSELEQLTGDLIESGLADSYGWPLLKKGADHTSVETKNGVDSSVIRARSYTELYDSQLASDSYNVRLPDGALLQMSYRFEAGKLATHRLAYLPSPLLGAFQDDPEIYIRSEPFAEIVGPQISVVPIRFDFDAREGVAEEVSHPTSHLTLGQYKHCRIPVSGPLTPSAFVEFVLTHFYSTPSTAALEVRGSSLTDFNPTLTRLEEAGTHVRVRASST